MSPIDPTLRAQIICENWLELYKTPTHIVGMATFSIPRIGVQLRLKCCLAKGKPGTVADLTLETLMDGETGAFLMFSTVADEARFTAEAREAIHVYLLQGGGRAA